MTEKIPIDRFKTDCLKVIFRVSRTQRKVVITKSNISIAEIRPIKDPKDKELFGKLKGTVHFQSDIIDPIEEKWCASS